MIRKRMSTIDDSEIYRLVVEQLVPFSRMYNSNHKVTFAEIRKRLNANKTLVIAKGYKRPYGFISISRRSKILFIDMLAVDSREQGKGVGHTLMKAAEDYGMRERCHSVELFVDDSNPKAIRFYSKMGYEIDAYISELSCYRMSKGIRG